MFSSHGEVLQNLRKVVFEYNSEGAANLAKKGIEEGIDPIEMLDAITEAIREVGDGFGKGELWLPDLIGAADAMQSAVPIIEGEIRRRGEKRESLGTVVIGTVYGDIHSLGKTMVCTFLAAGGFTVYDLGVNVSAEKFIEAVKKYKPDILAMSALLTTTAPEQKKVITTLEKEKLRDEVKVIVGGGAITQEFADEIKADGYDSTAPGVVKLAESLIKR